MYKSLGILKIPMYDHTHSKFRNFIIYVYHDFNKVYYIETLTSLYGLMKDVFLGHTTNVPALFDKDNAVAEFQAFKHQMFMYR